MTKKISTNKKKKANATGASAENVTAAAAESLVRKNPQVFQLNLSLKYIADLKRLFPLSMMVDNYRFPMIKQEDKQYTFFFAKMAYRHAGYTDDYENEQAKKKFMTMMCKISDLRMDSSGVEGMRLLSTVDEVMHACCTKISPNQWLVSFATNTDLFLTTVRNNTILLDLENAHQMQILFTIWQNTLDSIIHAQLTASEKSMNMGHHMRLYFFYQQVVDNTLQSFSMADIPTHFHHFEKPTLSCDQDIKTASLICLPMILPNLMYNFNLFRRMLDSYFDFRVSKENATKWTLAPFLIPASCKMDGMFPIYKQKSVTVSFDMERLNRAKHCLFDLGENHVEENDDDDGDDDEDLVSESEREFRDNEDDYYAKTHIFGRYSEPSKTAATDMYRVSVSGHDTTLKKGITDARMFQLLRSNIEPFHIFVPRKFLCAQVLTFMMSMNMSMWFLAVAYKTTYCRIEEIQFAIQMLHPTVGVNTHICNHTMILQSFLSCIMQIVYDPKTWKQEKEERSNKLQDLVSQLVYLVTLPTLRSSTAGGPGVVLKEAEQEEFINPFDRWLPIYQEVLVDFVPLVEEYFSIPNLFENPRKLSNPPLVSYESFDFASNMWIDPDNTRQFDYQAAEPSIEKTRQSVKSWMNCMTSFPEEDIEQFVNMQKYSL